MYWRPDIDAQVRRWEQGVWGAQQGRKAQATGMQGAAVSGAAASGSAQGSMCSRLRPLGEPS